MSLSAYAGCRRIKAKRYPRRVLPPFVPNGGYSKTYRNYPVSRRTLTAYHRSVMRGYHLDYLKRTYTSHNQAILYSLNK